MKTGGGQAEGTATKEIQGTIPHRREELTTSIKDEEWMRRNDIFLDLKKRSDSK